MSFASSATTGGAGALTVSDPIAMRALAHPIRIAILDFLAASGPSTATQAAEAVGQSVALCSYHLRTLAKHGFVEEVPATDGRERPWRRVGRTIRVSIGGEHEAERAAVESRIARDEQILSEYLAREAAEPETWREAALVISTAVSLTADELKSLGEELSALIDRHRGGRRRRAQRRVQLTFRGVPLPDQADGRR
ncbi:MAG TPA: helix-turn-helix domain-containing protein [Thermoleophilaceae bacterium]|nr:helix-turn-helix domain-containing protein [Thermoleophilaceae bacterium]